MVKGAPVVAGVPSFFVYIAEIPTFVIQTHLYAVSTNARISMIVYPDGLVWMTGKQYFNLNFNVMEQSKKWEMTPEQKAYKQSKDSFRAVIAGLVTAQKIEKAKRNTRDGRSVSDMSLAQTHSDILRNQLNQYYLGYSIVRSLYGGYTKMGYDHAKMILSNAPEGSFLKKIIEKHGPQTVHLNP